MGIGQRRRESNELIIIFRVYEKRRDVEFADNTAMSHHRERIKRISGSTKNDFKKKLNKTKKGSKNLRSRLSVQTKRSKLRGS